MNLLYLPLSDPAWSGKNFLQVNIEGSLFFTFSFSYKARNGIESVQSLFGNSGSLKIKRLDFEEPASTIPFSLFERATWIPSSQVVYKNTFVVLSFENHLLYSLLSV